MGTSVQSKECAEQEQEQEQEEPGLSQSQVPSVFAAHSYQHYYTPEDPMQGSSSMPCCHRPAAHSTCGLYLATQATAAEPATMLTQGERSPAHNRDTIVYPALLENNRLCYARSPVYLPTGFGECELTHVTSSIIHPIFLSTLDASLWKLFVSHLEG